MQATITVSIASAKKLADYLLAHEIDIAVGTDDFGELRSLFVDIMGRDPKNTA